MKESALYSKFDKEFKKIDKNAFIYKIPDTKGLGGKRPFDTFLVSLGVAIAIEFKNAGEKPTPYQAFHLKKMAKAGGIGMSHTYKSKEAFDEFVETVMLVRNQAIIERRKDETPIKGTVVNVSELFLKLKKEKRDDV